MRILVTIPESGFRDKVFTHKVLDKLMSLGDVEFNNGKAQFTKKQLAEKIRQKDALITGWTVPTIDGEMLKGNSVKFIGHIGGTLKDIVDRDVFFGDLVVVTGNEAFGRTVAEHNLMMHLIGARKAYDFIYNMKHDKSSWCSGDICVDGLNGKTIGIIGYGTITKWLIRHLKPFDIKILVYSNHLLKSGIGGDGFEVCTLDELLKRSDFVNVQTTLTPQTRHLISSEKLKLMKDNAVLVNAARGAIVDEKALIEELEKGRLFAVLDVYEQEPLPQDSKLRILDNAYCFPHVGGKTHECRENLGMVVVNALENFKLNRPIDGMVDLESYDRMTENKS